MASRRNQLVVVTGAGSGIGQATALHFAGDGAQVIVSDIDEAAADATVALINERGGRAYGYRLDVTDAAAWEAFAAGVRDDHGVPDILVNNAGILISGTFLDHSAEDWERIVGVNLMGVVHGCRVFGAQMVQRGEGGHIVNIASAAAFLPTGAMPAYSTTKAAVRMLSECLRIELGRHAIGVTVICPTVIRTNIARHGTVAGVDAKTEARFAQVGGTVMDRFAWTSPDKAARAIARSVRFNWAIVPVNPDAWVAYALSRISPRLVRGLSRAVSFETTKRAVDRLFPLLVREPERDDDIELAA